MAIDIQNKWQEVKLGDVCDLKGGKRLPKGSNLTTIPNRHPYVRVRDLGKNKILQLNENYEYVPEGIQKNIANYIVNKGDIVISIVGTIGLVGIVGDSLHRANLTENCVKLINIKNVDNNFLYYFLVSENGQNLIKQGTVGAVQAKLPIKNIQSFSISLPPLEVQKKIARVLGALDDKIELNNKINQNLEAQAQALFKSWFVDFEPFGGKMPDDWKIGKLGEITKITSGKRPLFKCNNKDKFVSIPIVGASDIMGYTNEVLYHDKILITGRVGTHGVIQRFCDACWPSDNTLVLFSNSYEYVYQCLKRIDFSAMNRGSTQPLITQNDLKNCDIIIPSEVWLNKFEHIAGKLLDLNENNEKENIRLAELRDSLLPKLMSGEINVDNVKID